MRKIILLLLAIVILMHAGVISPLFEIKQNFLKLGMLEKYSEKDCFVMKLSLNEFFKKRISDHEMIIDKELHDIVEVKRIDQYVILKLINDQIEKKYLNKTKDYKEKSSAGSKNKNHIPKVKFFYCGENLQILLIKNKPIWRVVKLNRNDSLICLQSEQGVESPPPEYTTRHVLI
ncbi:hypothetical protein [Flavobacterium davisii]|uniref:Uncharacterized protein n=3 Tax=Flavobacterium TaxID=237 RepID=A0A8G0P5T6_9FLAO|nr:hypothetical protein [Flavobacterium davisii]QYS88397.1 hypothetical protein JJC05_11925 [Flavobacterium davisii]